MVESVATDPRPTPERILDAALAAFADRGVEATSLDSLAVEIGIRKQTILYWFPSKEQLLLGVVDHAVAQLGARLSEAIARRTRRGPAADVRDLVEAGVDATFRLGRTHPHLLAVVREVIRAGPVAVGHLADAIEPLIDLAVASLPEDTDRARVRTALLGATAQVVGIVTEGEVRSQLGAPPDVAWLRARRRELLVAVADLGLAGARTDRRDL